MSSRPNHTARSLAALTACFLATTGCNSLMARHPAIKPPPPAAVVSPTVPRELSKAILPPYVIEPPDVLIVEAINIVPKPPYRLRPFDVVAIEGRDLLPDAPLSGNFTIEPGGFVALGGPYGKVNIARMTAEEATKAVEKQVATVVNGPQVTVTLVEVASKQQIAGDHLVGQDGTITLGSYGNVKVVGKTLPEAKQAIEKHLAQFLDEPEVSVDVIGFNSKIYYVITQGAGLGDRVARFPITGNETVLDAIAQVQGLEQFSSKRIWIARPAPSTEGCEQILPVDWCGITERGVTDSNYQLLPGDRVFVAEDRLVAMDTFVGKALAPFERIWGFISLGTNTVSSLRFFQRGQNFGGFGP